MSADLELSVRVRLGSFNLDPELEVPRGPIALVGPNGSGKTSLLRVLAGAVRPDAGTIRVRGRTLFAPGTDLPPEERRVGYLPQGFGLFEHLSAVDNVAYGIRGSRAERHLRAIEHLASVGVGALADRRPRWLSGGEKQRVALARALATAPELLLLDEPTAALDVVARPEIRELLASHLRSSERCAVVVTHDLRDLIAWDPTVVLIEAGRVCAQGTVAELRASDHPFLRELLAIR